MAEKESFIRFSDVKKIYKMGETEIPALAGVDFEINRGEVVIIAGASGAGKSTILNILGGMDTPTSGEIEVDGERIDRFPYTPDLYDCEPIYETLPGWNCDISKARRWEDLPKAAQDYVLYIEERVDCPIKYVSVGAEREALIIR